MCSFKLLDNDVMNLMCSFLSLHDVLLRLQLTCKSVRSRIEQCLVLKGDHRLVVMACVDCACLGQVEAIVAPKYPLQHIRHAYIGVGSSNVIKTTFELHLYTPRWRSSWTRTLTICSTLKGHCERIFSDPPSDAWTNWVTLLESLTLVGNYNALERYTHAMPNLKRLFVVANTMENYNVPLKSTNVLQCFPHMTHLCLHGIGSASLLQSLSSASPQRNNLMTLQILDIPLFEYRPPPVKSTKLAVFYGRCATHGSWRGRFSHQQLVEKVLPWILFLAFSCKTAFVELPLEEDLADSDVIFEELLALCSETRNVFVKKAQTGVAATRMLSTLYIVSRDTKLLDLVRKYRVPDLSVHIFDPTLLTGKTLETMQGNSTCFSI